MTDPSLLVAKIRARLPWCGLGAWPTPIEPADALAQASGLEQLWVKREDCSARAGGGNKVRGLEFLFGHAPKDTVFVTVGADGSTHCLATAVHAARFSGAVLAQFPQRETEASVAVRAAAGCAARCVVRARSQGTLPLAVVRAWVSARAFGRRRWIPAGGASARGVVGHLVGGCELASMPPPDAIVVPLGSGGTAAGLALAMGALGWPTLVVAARVAPRAVANGWRVRSLMRRTARLLDRHGISIGSDAPLMVIDALGSGYGVPTASGEAARATAGAFGLVLDPTYGAKAFGTLAALGAQGLRRVVFWHTFAWPGVGVLTPSSAPEGERR
ncbi:MAG TPA: pyridoxal-phosphate dependent enzyme [Gemmatimonadales bacterium]|nr:pyridoxal-phosphate dependent enzyme [Gemmatimonadales bacterium]